MSKSTHSGQKFVHPQSYAYYTDAIPQHIKSNPDTLFHFFTEYERKYIYDAM